MGVRQDWEGGRESLNEIFMDKNSVTNWANG